jgi:hypothetical protein
MKFADNPKMLKLRDLLLGLENAQPAEGRNGVPPAFSGEIGDCPQFGPKFAASPATLQGSLGRMLCSTVSLPSFCTAG